MIWVAGILTGCRIGELHEIRRMDLDLVTREQAIEQEKSPVHQRRYGFLRVRKSWKTRYSELFLFRASSYVFGPGFALNTAQ